jgi:hypothetical protein
MSTSPNPPALDRRRVQPDHDLIAADPENPEKLPDLLDPS